MIPGLGGGGGWGSGGAMMLGKLPNCLANLDALAVDAGGGYLDIFSLVNYFYSFSLSLGDGPI